MIRGYKRAFSTNKRTDAWFSNLTFLKEGPKNEESLMKRRSQPENRATGITSEKSDFIYIYILTRG